MDPQPGTGHTNLGAIRLVKQLGLGILVVIAAVALIVVIPMMLAPPYSSAELKDIASPKDKLQAIEERLKTQNAIRATIIQSIGGLCSL
jgi:hypothetical protein